MDVSEFFMCVFLILVADVLLRLLCGRHKDIFLYLAIYFISCHLFMLQRKHFSLLSSLVCLLFIAFVCYYYTSLNFRLTEHPVLWPTFVIM